MAEDVSDIPDSLKDALVKGRVIPFVGAGVSRSIEKKDRDSAKSFRVLRKLLSDIHPDTIFYCRI